MPFSVVEGYRSKPCIVAFSRVLGVGLTEVTVFEIHLVGVGDYSGIGWRGMGCEDICHWHMLVVLLGCVASWGRLIFVHDFLYHSLCYWFMGYTLFDGDIGNLCMDFGCQGQ